MFTGIITDIGEVLSITKNGDIKLIISTNYNTLDIAIGASVSCSGVCLTVVEKDKGKLAFDVSAETITKTNISAWNIGTKINLERALKVGDELGGHFVSGHVDGVATLEEIKPVGASYYMLFSAPSNLMEFIANKGSVALNGVSLTVNEVKNSTFSVNIIPHTMQKTNFSNLTVGDKLNIEIDILARYVIGQQAKKL